jgi:excisionase family DNA binding protein
MTNALSIKQFCERFGVGRTFVYEELKTGRLLANKAGSRTIIPLAEAESWFAKLPAYSASKAVKDRNYK